MTDGPRTAPPKHRRNCLEKIEELGLAEAGLAQYRAKRSGREIVPMNGHDCGWDHPGAAGNDATLWS